jgi:hypothetical protein
MLVAVFGAAAEPSVPSFAPFAQYGVVGTVAALGLWFMWQAYKRERDRGDRLEKRLEEALVEVAAVSRETAPAVQRSTTEAERSNQLLADLKELPALLVELRGVLNTRRAQR